MPTDRPLALTFIAALGLLVPHLGAQEIALEFQLLRMKPEIAEFLERRLLEGGDPAVEAEEKLPDLIAAGRIKSLANHRFKGRDNSRTESRSGRGDYELEGGETIPEGFYFEVEPSCGPDGTIHLQYFATHALKSARKPPHVLRIQAGVSLYPERLNFLQRCPTPDGELVLIAKPSASGEAAGSAPPGSHFSTIHAMATLYKLGDLAARDALLQLAREKPDAAALALSEGASQVDAIGAALTSGQRHEIRSFVPDFEAAEGMVYEDGTNIQFELTAGPTGRRIDVIADLAHYSPTGRRTRADGGDRTDERQLIHCGASREVAAGELNLFPCEVELVPGGGVRKPAPYLLAIRARCYGEFGDPPAPRKPIPQGDPAAMVTRTYAVPPSFLRVLEERNLRPANAQAQIIRKATAQEVLEASGIQFPGRARAVFIAQKSELILLHNRAAHQKLEELLADQP